MSITVGEQLPLLAGVPNGIGKLRELILELAVRGKLAAQDPRDEPASELLKRIAAEKKRLVVEGKIKQPKPQAEIAEEEKPFELPRGWEWVRLDPLLSKIGAGSTPLGGKQAYVRKGIKFLRSQNVWNEGLLLNDVAMIPEAVHQKMSGTHVEAGDLLFNITGASIGRCAVVPDNFDVANVSQHVTIVRPLAGQTRHFLHVVLTSALVQQAVSDVQVGVSREGLSIGKLARFVIPCPPEEEQHRIVAKVDELMALCDRLEAQQADAESAHAQLVATLLDCLTRASDSDDFAASWQRLSAHFHTLFTTESSIDALKQTLLQLAVMGKLVPQDPGDESARELLKRIAPKAEFVGKRQKRDSKSSVPERPFDPPAGWEWIRLSDLQPEFQNGVSSRGDSDGVLVTVIRLADIKAGEICLDETREITLSAATVSKSALEIGDVLIIRVNGSADLVGRFVVCRTASEAIPCDHFIRMRLPHEVIDSAYLKFAGDSEVTRASIAGLFVSTAGQKTVNQGHIGSLVVPLPPLAEQHRIVAKVDQLIALCDQLRSRLTQARQFNEQLAAALVQRAAA